MDGYFKGMIKGVIEALPRFHQGLCTGFKRLLRCSASAGVTVLGVGAFHG